MIDSNTNKNKYNSLSTDRSNLNEVNHVWFPRRSGAGYHNEAGIAKSFEKYRIE